MPKSQSVCDCVTRITKKTYERIFMKFCGVTDKVYTLAELNLVHVMINISYVDSRFLCA